MVVRDWGNVARGRVNVSKVRIVRCVAGAECAAQSAGRCDRLNRKSLERLWDDHIQLDRCIASLDEDGLIEILPNADVRLPV